MSTDEQQGLFGSGEARKDDRAKDDDDDVGFVCPGCGGRWFEVYYTRKTRAGVIRRRHCVRCGRSIMTHERVSSNGPSSTNGTN